MVPEDWALSAEELPGLSPALVQSMVYSSELDPEQSTDSLKACDWQHLFRRWQAWLQAIDQLQFQPGWTSQDTVIGWGMLKQAKDIQDSTATTQFN